ncbi:ankyrin repeat domain-containing protein, partial [Candidatus Bathyarchaeota archaeon]|nr:ankyrin repeat domain-containing protein [Candidatus Bathyarchaeota archaeon]
MTFIASVSDGTLTATILKQYIKTHDINDAPKGEHTSPLIAAVLAGEISSVELLLNVGGADPDRPTDDGMSPLAWVAERGRKNRAQVAWLLLQHKASVDAACKMGNTPLMRAVWSKDHELVRVLMDAKASTDHMNNVGESASSRAKLCGDEIDAMVNPKSGKPGLNLTDVVNILVGILRLILAWVNNASLKKIAEDVARGLQSLDDNVRPTKSMDGDCMNSWVNSQGGSGGSGVGGREGPRREERDEDGSSSAGIIRGVGKDMGQSKRQGHPQTHRVDGDGIDPKGSPLLGIRGDGANTAVRHPLDEVSGNGIDNSEFHQQNGCVGNSVNKADKALRERPGETSKKPLGINGQLEASDAAPTPPGVNTQQEASDKTSEPSGINSKPETSKAAPKPPGNIREQTTDDSEQKPPGIDDKQGPRNEEIEGHGSNSGEGLQAGGGGRLTRDTSSIDRKQDSTRHKAGDTRPGRDEPSSRWSQGQPDMDHIAARNVAPGVMDGGGSDSAGGPGSGETGRAMPNHPDVNRENPRAQHERDPPRHGAEDVRRRIGNPGTRRSHDQAPMDTTSGQKGAAQGLDGIGDSLPRTLKPQTGHNEITADGYAPKIFSPSPDASHNLEPRGKESQVASNLATAGGNAPEPAVGHGSRPRTKDTRVGVGPATADGDAHSPDVSHNPP